MSSLHPKCLIDKRSAMPKILTYTLSAALAAFILPSAAQAGEVFGGLYKHGVDTPLTLGGSPEDGMDFQLGYRTGPIISGT